ncbi:MAG: glycosyltransferase [Thermodesulfobacteriota bacterium]|nr:glycosyltransferase [Thermodesulfobacteriota bacterium]
METRQCKMDMHVHSRYSHRPSSWVLKKIGCSESYTDPAYLYRSLKSQGMNLVTITDHNTIAGAMEIAHLPDTFISEEITSYFPEDNCKLHVLVYNITEAQHADIGKVRENVYELVDYLDKAAIVHAVAHPMYSVNGLLRIVHFEKMLLLFNIIELNGARDSLQNAIVRRIVNALTPETITTLADRHDMAPRGDRPWAKHLISGSDDHSSLYMGHSWTGVPGALDVNAFLAGICCGEATVQTHDSGPRTLAHNIYSIMYQFYSETFQVDRWINDPDLSAFLENTFFPPDHARKVANIHAKAAAKPDTSILGGASVTDQMLALAKQVIFSNPELAARVKGEDTANADDAWMGFVNHVTEMIMRQFADDILTRLTRADLFYLFTTIGSSASLYMILSPYFIAYSLFSRDRQFALSCLNIQKGGGAWPAVQPRNIGMFTDTFNEINGVATAIRSQVTAATLTGKALTLINCDPGQTPEANVMGFDPIGEFELPEYPELKVYYPPVLNIIEYCYNQQFTHIHAETPGAMGLTALAVARILDLPFYGTYHTSLPQTVGALTGDPQIEELFWKYMVWFYGQMERIYVPSAMTGQELIDKGLPAEKIIVHQWGVNITDFHPDKRNGFFANHYQMPDTMIKLIYVGRVSKEKNLQMFEAMMRQICRVRKDVCLVIVGEGPYMKEMQEALADLPVVFTGYLTGEDLSQAYASSDIFLFPSTVDTMGNVVVEAQASGVPVIVTDQGGPSENMIHEETGFVLPADDSLADRFAETVLDICNHPDMLAAMRQKARTYTRQRSFENSFLTFWQNYEEAAPSDNGFVG